MIPLFQGAAPVTEAPTDLFTYLSSGGRFQLPPEAVAMVVSAALFAAAALILLVSDKKDRKGKK